MGRKALFKQSITSVECTWFVSVLIDELKHLGESKSDTLTRILTEYADPHTVDKVKRKLLEKKLKAPSSVEITSGSQMLLTSNRSLDELQNKDMYKKEEILTYIAKKLNLSDEMASLYFRKGLHDGTIQNLDENCFMIRQEAM